MRLTERDTRILEAVHAFDGLLGDYQIRRLFFTGERQTRGRLSLLFQHGYLEKPSRAQRASLPCMVYWLGKRGAAHVAGLRGQTLKQFAYRREPRWSQVAHDLAVNDFRLDVIEACRQNLEFSLEEWIPESEFWAHPDTVVYKTANGKTAKRQIRPDGFFVIHHGKYHSRLLLELDCATEDNPRFAREKVRPGVAYLRSDAYKQRFGFQSGRWLVVTTSERRMRNLKQQAEIAAGKDARAFLFTTAVKITPQSVLKDPIWLRGGDDKPSALFPNSHTFFGL
ncbi:MAG: hypothetical protein GX573_14600 [Chloroflexi bacterium]|nr:hypothetical protein [Chloroflexota bacterium]